MKVRRAEFKRRRRNRRRWRQRHPPRRMIKGIYAAFAEMVTFAKTPLIQQLKRGGDDVRVKWGGREITWDVKP